MGVERMVFFCEKLSLGVVFCSFLLFPEKKNQMHEVSMLDERKMCEEKDEER